MCVYISIAFEKMILFNVIYQDIEQLVTIFLGSDKVCAITYLMYTVNGGLQNAT